jgi:SAM-dependent methyltransferase
MSVAGNPTELSPERAMPEQMAGSLMESEHRGRYLWAAQLAEGREVLDAGCGTGYGTAILAAAGARRVVGVDVSKDAIEYARSSTAPAPVSEFSLGSIHELPFEDSTFDLAVCFEVIEHVDDQDLAISELRRILRPTGVLVMSSPNRNVYPPGNPHHTHEYVPEELELALASQFKNVRLYRQSPWLAAAIFGDEQSRSVGLDAEMSIRVIKAGAVEPGREVFTIALASNGDLPTLDPLALVGEPFEVRWWEEQLAQANSQRKATDEKYERAREEFDRRHIEFARTLLDVETDLAKSQNTIAQLLAAEADLKRWAARKDELVRRREEEAEDFENRLRRAERTIEEITKSPSWRITRPLRAVKRLMS